MLQSLIYFWQSFLNFFVNDIFQFSSIKFYQTVLFFKKINIAILTNVPIERVLLI